MMVMDESVGVGGEIAEASSSPSPRGRLKFSCSYGGKIMLRPNDPQLKYVGGETRIVAVPRDITFQGLMKKLGAEFEGEMVLKYQILPEDLDVLVSVRTDRDLELMLDEYDRHDKKSIKFRTFLFPVNPVTIEQRSTPMARPRPVHANQLTHNFSPISSPHSKSSSQESIDMETNAINNYHDIEFCMSKVQSSPNLYSFNMNQHSHGNNTFYHHQHQHHQQHNHHHHHGYQNFRQSYYHAHKLSPTSPIRRPYHRKISSTNGIYFFSRLSGASESSQFYNGRSVYSLPPSPRQEGFLM